MEKVSDHILLSCSTQLRSIIHDAQLDGTFTDVTLVSDDQISTKAHKCVLSAASPVLKNLLLSDTSPDTFIYFTGVGNKELQILIQAFYRGDKVKSVIDLVKDLHAEEAITICTKSEENSDKIKLNTELSGEGEVKYEDLNDDKNNFEKDNVIDNESEFTFKH